MLSSQGKGRKRMVGAAKHMEKAFPQQDLSRQWNITDSWAQELLQLDRLFHFDPAKDIKNQCASRKVMIMKNKFKGFESYKSLLADIAF